MQAEDVRHIVRELHRECTGEPVQLASGWSGTQIWRVELSNGPHLVRIFQPGEDIVARREIAAMNHGANHGLPVARDEASGISGGRAVVLLEWIEGRELREALIAEPERARDYGEQFGRLQARLHRLDPPPDAPPAINWPARDVYPAQLLQLLDNLPMLPNRFLHLDFHPANVLVDGGRISGLIDWTNGGRGDPRFDLARTWVILRALPGLDGETKAQFRPVITSFTDGWHRAYRTAMGPIDGITPYLAWAGYGLLADLRWKPASLIGEEAARDLIDVLKDLERDTSRWMSMVGLSMAA